MDQNGSAHTNGPNINNMNGNHVPAATEQNISADEIALYDRQIRLWGVQAQERIRLANILLVSVRAIGTEVAKNLILGGIKSLTIVDNGTVTEDDLGAQYFLRETDVGSNRAEAAVPRLQELNPRVAVKADRSAIVEKEQQYYAAYDMVIVCDLPFNTMQLINSACRVAMRPFYATGIHGFYGFIFADLIAHEYIIQRDQSNATKLGPETPTRSIIGVSSELGNNKKMIETITKKEMYSHILMANTSPLAQVYLKSARRMKGVTPLLPALRALWEFERAFGRAPAHSHEDLAAFTSTAHEKVKELQLPPHTLTSEFLRKFLANIGSEITPTAAFVGGRLAEDVINVLGKREQPIQNLVLFDGDECQAPMYALHPIFADDDVAVTAAGIVPVAVPVDTAAIVI